MAGKKENLKALFTNTRSRIIILFTAIVLIIAVLIGVFHLTSITSSRVSTSANVPGTPGIQSVPGSLDPTAQYASLVQTQNEEQAKQASKAGGSAIPTIIRTQAFGEGVQSVGPQQGEGGLGFAALAQEDSGGAQRSLWLQSLKDSNCSSASVKQVVNQGAMIADLKAGCSCVQLKDNGYKLTDLQPVCSCPELKASGFNAVQLKAVGFTASKLRLCGFDACELRSAGFPAADMKNGGFSDGELKGAGYPEHDIGLDAALPDGTSSEDIRKAGCNVAALIKLRQEGVSASTIRRINGCSASQLKAAGYSALDLKNAGFSAADLKNAGFSAQDLLAAGFTPEELKRAGMGPGAQQKKGDCSVASLTAARASGESALTIKQTLGCSAEAMKAAGFTAAELRAAGFTAAELKNAGFTAAELRAAGFSAQQLKDAGFTAAQLKDAGFPDQAAVLPPNATVPGLAVPIQTAIPSIITNIPSIAVKTQDDQASKLSNAKQLQEILNRQQNQMADQRSQQKIQQRTSLMLGAATQSLQIWKNVSTQAYVGSTEEDKSTSIVSESGVTQVTQVTQSTSGGIGHATKALVKTGDIVFAVIDTAINSDEPGPILATVVSGQFKGAKLIGSFNLPSNADKMVISFNTMSVPGAAKSTGISAYAIDANTARTALSSSTNHHYLSRYGSLFAATFLEGFGNAFQSADTTITIGGANSGTSNTTISNGAGRSLLENAVIGLATLGKNWGQVAQQQFSRPTTVQVCAGTGIGVLFTQDLTSL